jgi:hypothetical protein
MHEALNVVEPSWIGELIGLLLPENVDVRALYYSWAEEEDEKDRVRALMVSPSRLLGFAGDNGEDREALTLRAVPMSAVRSITSGVGARFSHYSGVVVRENSFRVKFKLSVALEPFGSEIQLPLTRQDYSGSRERASEAARHFADSLLAVTS